MRLLSVDNYIEFKCVGGSCPISCCGGNWGIYIDDESLEYYMSIEGEFGDRLRDNIVIKNGRKAFRLDEVSRDCVFLDENKLCCIYKTLGSDALCETCRFYPRALYQAGDIAFCYMSNSCPEINRMVITRKKSFDTLFDDSEESPEEEDKAQMQRLNNALSALALGLKIICNREMDLSNRLKLLILFVIRFEELEKEQKDPTDIIDAFSDISLCSRLLENEFLKRSDYPLRLHAFKLIFNSLMSESYDHDMWKVCNRIADEISDFDINDIEKIEEIFKRNEFDEIQLELEQIMAYRFFAVFMRGYENKDYLEKVAYECVLCAAYYSFAILSKVGQGGETYVKDRILFYSLCGRIEHTSNQKRNLIEKIRQEGFFEPENLLRLV